MKLLCSHGLGSRFYASFSNGIAYEFLPGKTLTVESVRRDDIFPGVAKLLKKVHSVPAPDSGSTPGMWDLLRKFHRACPDETRSVFSKSQILDEIDKMETVLRQALFLCAPFLSKI